MTGRIMAGKCRICGQRILFIRMKSGKIMPVNDVFINYTLSGNKKERVVTIEGDVVACDGPVPADEADGFGYISHFATCRRKS